MFGRIGKTGKIVILAGVALAFTGLGAGCSNQNAKMDALSKQNEALAAQLRAEKERADNAEARANQATASAANPTPETTPPPAGPGPTDTGIPDMGPVTGSPEITVGHNARGETQLEIKGDVLFDTGKATLKPAAKKVLDSAVGMIKSKYSGAQLRVEGHTDPTPIKSGTWDDNWDLGSARARSVMLYLKTKGVKNMYIASFADTELKSKTNFALDRRVDIVVVGK